MGLVVLDASVVIGFFDPSDAHHAGAVSGIASHRADEMVIPASAYAEILVGPCRSGARALEKIHGFLESAAIRVHPIDAEIAKQAGKLRAKHSTIKLPDALVLATGLNLSADVILTADKNWRKIVRGVQLI